MLFGGQAGVADIGTGLTADPGLGYGWHWAARCAMFSSMADETEAIGAQAEFVLGPIPPHVQICDFLSEREHRRLLEWAEGNRSKFRPATVNSSRTGINEVDPDRRIALATRKLDDIASDLRERFLEAFPAVAAATGYRGLPPTSLELEVAAHGDGAYFGPHIDIPVGPNRKPLSGNPHDDRLLSAVYYFHRSPRAFSGGELRLFRLGADPEGIGQDPANHVDIDPIDNSLVAFPSWVTHEVRRICCPGVDFAHYRFALNCWYCRPLGKEGASP